MPVDPFAAYQQPLQAIDPFAAYQKPLQGAAPAVSHLQNADLQHGPLTNVGIGALKGLGNTVSGVGDLIQKIPGIGSKLIPSTGQTAFHAMNQPQGTGQQVGHGIEQAGEFLLPTGAEAKAGTLAAEHFPQMARIAAPAARIATGGLESGVRNKLQGGDFSTGAAGGALGGAVGEGMRSLAPAAAESALGIRKIDRAYGKTPGRAILDETKGFNPETVAASARDRLNLLNPELESAAATSPNRASLQPARDVVQGALNKATVQGEPKALSQLEPMASHLQANRVTGKPLLNTASTIPNVNQTVSPSDLLNIKRGFGNEFVHNWNPETMKGVKSTGAKAYHGLSSEFDKAVPEAAGLNQRISSLIPVAKRGESAALNAPLAQRVLGRVGAHTGALAGAGIGGAAGYKEGGLPGAVIGGASGAILPELIASPGTGMMVARGLNSPNIPLNAVRGGLLQLNKDKAKQ